MLTCQACMRRYLRLVIGDLPGLSTTPRSTSKPNAARRISARQYNTLAKQKEDETPPVRGVAAAHGERKTNARQEWIESRGIRPAWKKETPKPLNNDDERLRRTLKNLKDPVKLADHVRDVLRRGDFETAQKLVRAASRDVHCVVSWNYLIDFQLDKGQMNAAIKTFNEMKKRAQFPDGHTYGIIFKGCAQHPHASAALAKVMMIYQSMLSETSRVKPTAVHFNSILKMCAHAQNTDAMLAVAEQMPRKGPGAPDNMTYTTIFNAFRLSIVKDLRNTITPMQKREHTRKVMQDAHRIWADATKRSSQGDLYIDEELTCSMGRLLLVGSRQDRDDILTLIEQTMNIPRQVPRLGTEARTKIDPLASSAKPSSGHETDAYSPPGEVKASRSNEDSLPAVTAVDHFQPVQSPTRNGAGGVYARPGRNSLSLILLALLEMKLIEPAYKYWHIFTAEHNVKPDQENFHSFLRILRLARASNQVVNFLQTMPIQDMKHSTFRIAMATCRRDKLNKDAFANGGKLLDLMQTALEQPDIAFLEDYLELAITAPAYSEKVSSSGKNEPSKLAQGNQILRALDRLNPSFLNLKAFLHFEEPEKFNKGKLLVPRGEVKQLSIADSIFSLTRTMIRCYTILMDKSMVPRESYGPLIAQRNKLTAFVNRRKSIRPKAEPWNVNREKERDHLVKWADGAVEGLARPEYFPPGYNVQQVTEQEARSLANRAKRRARSQTGPAHSDNDFVSPECNITK